MEERKGPRETVPLVRGLGHSSRCVETTRCALCSEGPGSPPLPWAGLPAPGIGARAARKTVSGSQLRKVRGVAVSYLEPGAPSPVAPALYGILGYLLVGLML